MNRREFLRCAGTFTLAGTTIAVMTACGGGEKGAQPAGDGSGDIRVHIVNNHGHRLDLNESELATSTPLHRTLTGGTHTHALDLEASEVDKLLAGTEITVISGPGAKHTHEVVLTPMA
jgi:hypothetical protein